MKSRTIKFLKTIKKQTCVLNNRLRSTKSILALHKMHLNGFKLFENQTNCLYYTNTGIKLFCFYAIVFSNLLKQT